MSPRPLFLLNRPTPAVAASALALLAEPALAEIEAHSGYRNPLIATDHTGPEQIGPVVHHHDEDGSPGTIQFEFSTGVDSRYVLEGRDVLPGEGGIGWATAVGHYHALGGSIFAEAIGIAGWEADYQELNLTAGYEFELGPVTLGGGITWLWFPEDDADDFEFALSAEWLTDAGVGLAVEAVWSVEAEGWFGEAKLFYPWQLCKSFALIPSVFLGVNQGYVSDGHDGANHLGLLLEGAVPLGDNLELSVFAAWLEPLEEQPGEDLRDLFWFGGALTVTF